jgi:hypothetical protein
MRPIRVLLAFLLLGSGPASAEAQDLMELLWGIQQGGGWVRIPVEQGEGSIRTVALPVGGLRLTGCTQVWGGHSGSWDIHARDLRGDGTIDVSLQPGEPMIFAYQAGTQSQLQVDVRWSEPRDTTLLLWIGVETPLLPRDPCEPLYARR